MLEAAYKAGTRNRGKQLDIISILAEEYADTLPFPEMQRKRAYKKFVDGALSTSPELIIRKERNDKNRMINIFLEKLNNKYHFNSGGCCYVAYLIAKELEEMNEPFYLIIQNSSWKGNHYCISCPKFGIINPFEDYQHRIQFRASSDTIKRIYDDNEWSMKYDTSKNAELAKEIKNIFNLFRVK